MSALSSFWSSRVEAGASLMLQPPEDSSIVLTEVALAGATPITSRVMLTASVETLLVDQEKQDDDFQSIQNDVVLASFLPGEPRAKKINVGFRYSDICHLQADGAALVVSGYIEKSTIKLVDFARQ